MKNKILIPLFIVIIVAIGIGIFISTNDKKEMKENKIDQTSNQVETKPTEEDLEVEGQSNVEQKENEVHVDTPKDSSSSTTEKKEVKKNESTKNNNRNTTTNSGNNVNSSSNTSEHNKETDNKSNTNVVEQTTTQPNEETGLWTAWGKTKDEYYNKPLYSWEHVDFSVEKYGSESACQQACINYGDNYGPYLNGEVLYNCSTVNSASGKYLGEMFHTEKLN